MVLLQTCHLFFATAQSTLQCTQTCINTYFMKECMATRTRTTKQWDRSGRHRDTRQSQHQISSTYHWETVTVNNSSSQLLRHRDQHSERVQESSDDDFTDEAFGRLVWVRDGTVRHNARAVARLLVRRWRSTIRRHHGIWTTKHHRHTEYNPLFYIWS